MWQAYYQLEPWGDERADWHAASIVQMLHNINARAQHQKPLKDFVLKFSEEGSSEQEQGTRQTWQQQLAMMKIFAAAQNAFVASKQREAPHV